MKNGVYGVGFVVLCLSLFAMSCNTGSGSSSSGGNPYAVSNPSFTVTGTITVSAVSDWDKHVRVGLFSDEANSSGFWPKTLDNGTSKDYRLVYTDSYSKASVLLTPVTSIAISATSGTTQTYSFTLPSTIPTYGVLYYFLAWFDEDNDGTLKVIDSSWSDVVVLGEFNRSGWKSYADANGVSWDAAATRFQQDPFKLNSDVWTSYLLYYPSTTPYNVYNYLTTDNDDGYNFQMIPINGADFFSNIITGW